MGLCQSDISYGKNKTIEEQILKDKRTNKCSGKILLLGIGESGKSTIFKQFNANCGVDKTDSYEEYIPKIYNNIINGVTQLINIYRKSHNSLNPAIDVLNDQIMKLIEDPSIVSDYIPDPESIETLSCKIQSLWSISLYKEIYNDRNKDKYYISDGVGYFLDNIYRIFIKNYIPVEQDIFHVRSRTTGIAEIKLKFADDSYFNLIDVGGQNIERRKWFTLFNDITAVIYCAALSDYNARDEENEEGTRLNKSINIFRTVILHPFLAKTAIILFLNKKDVFKEKIEKSEIDELNKYLPDFLSKYTQNSDKMKKEGKEIVVERLKYLTGISCIKNTFIDGIKKEGIFSHVTCAVDKENINKVINAVRECLMTNKLGDLGFI